MHEARGLALLDRILWFGTAILKAASMAVHASRHLVNDCMPECCLATRFSSSQQHCDCNAKDCDYIFEGGLTAFGFCVHTL